MKQPLTRRERKKQETRLKLMKAAQELFREKGYEETTIEEITEKADVAKGTFFNYFPTKDDLLGDLSSWAVSRIRQELDVSHGAPASPMKRVRLLAGLIHRLLVEDFNFLHRNMTSRLFILPPKAPEIRHQLTEILLNLVKEAQAAGEIRADYDPELISELIHWVLIHHILVCRRDANSGVLNKFDTIIELLMEGLAGRPSQMER